MDENQMENNQEGMPSANQEAPVTPSPEPALAADQAAAPAPKSKLPMVLGGIIVVLIIAIVACFALGVFGGDPEKALDKAFEATAQDQEAFLQQLQEELPAFRLLYGGESGARSSDFQFTLGALEFASASPEELALVNQFVQGSGMHGTFVSDPENSVYELDGTLQLAGMDLLGLYGYLSPDQVAFGVPDFSETALSVNLQTLAEDLTNSPLTAGSISPEEAQQAQDAIQALLQYMNALMNIQGASAEMEEDIMAMLSALREGATYEDLGSEDGLKVYAMDIPGSNVKQFLSDLVEYIYVDSSVGQAMAGLYNAAGGMELNYQDWLQQEMLSVLQSEEMPELPLHVVVKVGSGDLIRGMDISLDSPELAAQGLEELRFFYTEDENHNQEGAFYLKASDAESGTAVELNVPVTATYQDGVYQIAVSLSLPETEGVVADMTETISMGQDGSYQLGFDYTINVQDQAYPDANMDATVNFNMEGTVTEDGDAVTYDFPTIQMSVGSAGEVIGFSCSASATSTPVEGPYTISRPTLELLTASQEELNAELQKYMDGFENLVGPLMGSLMGASMMEPAA